MEDKLEFNEICKDIKWLMDAVMVMVQDLARSKGLDPQQFVAPLDQLNSNSDGPVLPYVADKFHASKDADSSSSIVEAIKKIYVDDDAIGEGIVIQQADWAQHELEPPPIHESVDEFGQQSPLKLEGPGAAHNLFEKMPSPSSKKQKEGNDNTEDGVLSFSEMLSVLDLKDEEIVNGSAIGSLKAWVKGVIPSMEVVWDQNVLWNDAHKVFDEMTPTFQATVMNEQVMDPYISGINSNKLTLFDPGGGRNCVVSLSRGVVHPFITEAQETFVVDLKGVVSSLSHPLSIVAAKDGHCLIVSNHSQNNHSHIFSGGSHAIFALIVDSTVYGDDFTEIGLKALYEEANSELCIKICSLYSGGCCLPRIGCDFSEYRDQVFDHAFFKNGVDDNVTGQISYFVDDLIKNYSLANKAIKGGSDVLCKMGVVGSSYGEYIATFAYFNWIELSWLIFSGKSVIAKLNMDIITDFPQRGVVQFMIRVEGVIIRLKLVCCSISDFFVFSRINKFVVLLHTCHLPMGVLHILTLRKLVLQGPGHCIFLEHVKWIHRALEFDDVALSWKELCNGSRVEEIRGLYCDTMIVYGKHDANQDCKVHAATPFQTNGSDYLMYNYSVIEIVVSELVTRIMAPLHLRTEWPHAAIVLELVFPLLGVWIFENVHMVEVVTTFGVLIKPLWKTLGLSLGAGFVMLQGISIDSFAPCCELTKYGTVAEAIATKERFLSSKKVVFVMATTLENFIWDPGQCVISFYILEGKDAFERVGKRIIPVDITWVIMEVIKDVQNKCIIMGWCEMAGYLNTSYGYMLQTEEYGEVASLEMGVLFQKDQRNQWHALLQAFASRPSSPLCSSCNYQVDFDKIPCCFKFWSLKNHFTFNWGEFIDDTSWKIITTDNGAPWVTLHGDDTISVTGNGVRDSKLLYVVAPLVESITFELARSPIVRIEEDETDKFVDWTVLHCFLTTGSICCATFHLLTHVGIATKFLDRFIIWCQDVKEYLAYVGSLGWILMIYLDELCGEDLYYHEQVSSIQIGLRTSPISRGGCLSGPWYFEDFYNLISIYLHFCTFVFMMSICSG